MVVTTHYKASFTVIDQERDIARVSRYDGPVASHCFYDRVGRTLRIGCVYHNGRFGQQLGNIIYVAHELNPITYTEILSLAFQGRSQWPVAGNSQHAVEVSFSQLLQCLQKPFPPVDGK